MRDSRLRGNDGWGYGNDGLGYGNGGWGCAGMTTLGGGTLGAEGMTEGTPER